ncbi:MAG: hypothetical protein HKN30_14290 [Sulfitobacter sp.]|nr:hypothetical protein [Sulfitobacter sp.]
MDDRALEALFEAERAAPPVVPEALMQRVFADALTVQPSADSRGWRGWLRLLGGAPGLGGLVAAGCVGVWLGLAPPTALPDLAGLVLGVESTEVYDGQTDGLTGFGWDLEES